MALLKVGNNMIDFIDKTNEQDGTPINRENLMAIQGFVGMTTEKLIENGLIVIKQTNSEGHELKTVKNADGSFTQTFTGEKVISKTIKKQNGKIVEVVS